MYREIIKFLPDEILVYLRKSRTDDPTLTVEEVLQKHKMIALEWIEKNLDAPIPEENWYSEIGSGGENIENRPEFQKVLKRIEDKKIRAIFVSEVSRLGRPDLEEIGRMIDLFDDEECRQMAKELNYIGWKMLLSHYDNDMQQLAAPQMRSYSTLTGKRIEEYVCFAEVIEIAKNFV